MVFGIGQSVIPKRPWFVNTRCLMLKPTWFHVLCVLLIPFLDWKKTESNSVCYVQIGEITTCVGENIMLQLKTQVSSLNHNGFPFMCHRKGPARNLWVHIPRFISKDGFVGKYVYIYIYNCLHVHYINGVIRDRKGSRSYVCWFTLANLTSLIVHLS